MEKYNKALLITSLGIGVAGGVAYLLSSFFSTKDKVVKYQKEDVLKMIKEYKRACLRVFVKSAEIVLRI